MAERKQAEKPKADRETKRVVLRRERVVVVPEGAEDKVMEALTSFGGDEPVVQEAWVICGEFSGATKEKAIEAHAGKPGTPDAAQGTFKAPTAAAWAGGARYSAPPQPLIKREAIE